MPINLDCSAPIDPTTLIDTDCVLGGTVGNTGFTASLGTLLTALLRILTGGALTLDANGDLTTSGNLSGNIVNALFQFSSDSDQISSDSAGNLTVGTLAVTGPGPGGQSNLTVCTFTGDPNGSVFAAMGSLCLNSAPTGSHDRLWVNTDGDSAWVYLTAPA